MKFQNYEVDNRSNNYPDMEAKEELDGNYLV